MAYQFSGGGGSFFSFAAHGDYLLFVYLVMIDDSAQLKCKILPNHEAEHIPPG
jgi:hypothetical protein